MCHRLRRHHLCGSRGELRRIVYGARVPPRSGRTTTVRRHQRGKPTHYEIRRHTRLGWTLRIFWRYERGRLRVDDKSGRKFLNVWGNCRQSKPSGSCRTPCCPRVRTSIALFEFCVKSSLDESRHQRQAKGVPEVREEIPTHARRIFLRDRTVEYCLPVGRCAGRGRCGAILFGI